MIIKTATILSLLLKLDKYAQYLTIFKNASNIRGNLPNSPRTAELVDRRTTSNKYLQSYLSNKDSIVAEAYVTSKHLYEQNKNS
jgi:hypothetical protein